MKVEVMRLTCYQCKQFIESDVYFTIHGKQLNLHLCPKCFLQVVLNFFDYDEDTHLKFIKFYLNA